MASRKYISLQHYMESTGTTARALLDRLFVETGRRISPAMFSYILRGGRKCSRWNAWGLHAVTG